MSELFDERAKSHAIRQTDGHTVYIGNDGASYTAPPPPPDFKYKFSRALVGGVREAGQGLIDMRNEMSEILAPYAELLPTEARDAIITGMMGFTAPRTDDSVKTIPDLPEVDAPDAGVAENLLRGLVQFGTGAAAAPIKGAGLLAQMGRGAFSDALFNPEDGNLSTMLKEFGLDGAVLDFLDSQVDEDAGAEERLKARVMQSLEGAGLGALVDGAMAGFRAIRSDEGLVETVKQSLSETGTKAKAAFDAIPVNTNTMYGNPIFAAFDAVKKAYDASPNDPEIKAEYTRVWTERNRALSADQPNTDYRGSHQPSGPEDENPVRLDNVSISTNGESAGYPSDFYGANGAKYYAPGPRFADDEFGIANQESYTAIIAAKDNPDAEVTIYRAVPNDESIATINRGDFVTLSPKYAELHGSSGYGQTGDDTGKVISETVKVKDIYFAGDDVNEFGYFPNVQISKEPIGDGRITTNTTDASSTFGEGAVYKTYTDPESGGLIRVMQRKDGSASVLDLEVPEESQGKGIGQALQSAAMQDNPVLTGQISSKAAATTAYRLGRRPSGQPDATLDDVFATIDDMSSVNLVSPAAQPNDGIVAKIDPPTDNTPGIIAFHGSAADFDGFKLEKIGTGEGAQAYGYGLYFADKEAIADFYRGALTDAPFDYKIGGQSVSEMYRNAVYAENYELADVLEQVQLHDTPKTLKAKFTVENGYAQETADFVADLDYDKLTGVDVDGKEIPLGRIYKVGLTPKPDDLLDYDKALSEHPQAIQEMVIATLKANGAYPGSDAAALKMQGANVLEALSSNMGAIDWPVGADAKTRQQFRTKGEANASQALFEAGIPGIKYLDGNSRNSGTGSTNYVIFDDSMIKILEKYGIVGPVAISAAAASKGGQKDDET